MMGQTKLYDSSLPIPQFSLSLSRFLSRYLLVSILFFVPSEGIYTYSTISGCPGRGPQLCGGLGFLRHIWIQPMIWSVISTLLPYIA